jgi:hypothetical protein
MIYWHLNLAFLDGLCSPAADLPVLGGLPPLLDALACPDPALAEGAAAVLGTAASNNIAFQQQLLAADPGIVEKLLKVSWGGRRG